MTLQGLMSPRQWIDRDPAKNPFRPPRSPRYTAAMSILEPFIRLPRADLVAGREEIILARSANKRVLHVGCVDAGLLEERYARGVLLHQRMAEVTTDLWGIDIDAEGISFLRDRGYRNLVVGDVCQKESLEALRDCQFDLIVASEVMEHLENPGLFLEALRDLMKPGQTELILTVPNAFRLETFFGLWRRVEIVHPDHNYWFSFHTITNLLRKKGFTIDTVIVYALQQLSPLGDFRRFRNRRNGPKSRGPRAETAAPGPGRRSLPARALAYAASVPRRTLTSLLLRRTPFWGDGLIVVARRAEAARKE